MKTKKQSIQIFLCLAGACVLFTSCSKDDSKSSENSMYDSDSELNVGDTSDNGTVLTEENVELCDATCTRLVECDSEEFTDCNAECVKMATSLRQSVLDGVAECVAAQTCANISADECMTAEILEVPDAVVNGFIGDLCTKMNTCDGNVPVADCTTEMQQGDEGLTFMKVFNDNVLDCLGMCFESTPCDGFFEEMDTLMEGCLVSCGADMGGDDNNDDESSCAEIAGDWQVDSVSCSGTDLTLGDIVINQHITSDCGVNFSVTNGGCVISYVGYYNVSDEGSALTVSSVCGSGCTEDDCNVEGAETTMDVSIDTTVSSFILTYNVTPAVLTVNMSPCQQGELNVSVFSPQ